MEYKKIGLFSLKLVVIQIFFFWTIKPDVNYNNKNENSINNVVKSNNYQNTKSSWSGENNSFVPDPNNNTLETIKQYLNKAKHISNSYRSQIILCSLLGTYGITYYLLFTGNNYLKKETLWSSWPLNKSFYSLLEIPQQQLALQLLDEIKQRYNGHTNFVQALTTFKENIEKEKSNLLFYDKIYKFLNKSYIIAIFPVSSENFTQIKVRLERIAYLKNIFLSWSTTLPDQAKNEVKKKDSTDKPIYDSDKLNVNINNEFCPNTLNYLSNSNIQNAILKCFTTAGHLPGYLSNTIKNAIKTSKNFYLKNQKYIIPGTLFTSYSATLLALHNGNQYVKNHQLWSLWKQEKNLEQLMQLPQQDLLYGLIVEIQKRYVNTKYPVDFISPLSDFMKELEKEKNKLLFYAKLHKILYKSYLLYLFPIKTDNFAKINDLLARLSFIRDIFLNWIAKYNVEQSSGLIGASSLKK